VSAPVELPVKLTNIRREVPWPILVRPSACGADRAHL